MRTLSSTLENAQKSSSIKAIYKIVLTSGATTYTYEQDRILPSSHDEELYSHRATIILDNSDAEFDDKDLKGYQGVISYGAVGKTGAEYSATAPVWVIDQQFNSQPGKLTCELILEGIPNLMAEDEASANYIPASDDTETVKSLVDAIAGATLACFNHCKAFTVEWDTGYDSLADTYMPKDSFRIYVGGNRLAAIRRLLDYTANVARFEDDGKVHILKPVSTGTDYDYEYNLQSGHTIFSKAYRDSLVIPNKVIVQSRPNDSPSYSGSAQISGYADLPDELKKTNYIQARLANNAQATSIAEAVIAKAEMWAERGSAEVPMNVGAEVFDYVKATDQRQGDARTGNLGYVHRRFGGGKWLMTFGFGNWTAFLRYRQILKELETYTPEIGQSLDKIDMVWLDPDNNIDLSLIGDDLDNLPDGESYARVRALHLDAAGLNVLEDTLYYLNYNAEDGEKTFWKSATAPTDPTPEEGDFWLDTSGAEDVLKRYNGSSWVEASEAQKDAVLGGVLYRRQKTATLTADGLVILDNLYFDAGSTYALTLASHLSAGKLKLTSETIIDGLWYSESGVDIDANQGINIYGVDNALTTRATKTGTIQCYVGADGKFYAGAGNVSIDSNGITVKGETLRFYYGTTSVGIIKAVAGLDLMIAGGGVIIESAGGEDMKIYSQGASGITICAGKVAGAPGTDDLDLQADDDVKIEPDDGFYITAANIDLSATVLRPTAAAGLDLGTSTYYFNAIHYKTLTDEGCPAPALLNPLDKLLAMKTRRRFITLKDVEREGMGKQARKMVEAVGGQGEFDEWDRETFPEEILIRPTEEDYMERDEIHKKNINRKKRLGTTLKHLRETLSIETRQARRQEIEEKISELEARLAKPLIKPKPKIGVNVTNEISLIVKAIQELAGQIKALETRVDAIGN